MSDHSTVAAVDLGSNSFHMLVAHRDHGELRVLDRIKRMVRLGEGLDGGGSLDATVRDRALAALEEFGQRLRGIPTAGVRVVGTRTLRSMRHPQPFLVAAETALGHPVEIISGMEEARLIYLGVARSLADDGERRLVVDIGGGSTELIIGEGETPLTMDSLDVGCVSLTNALFSDGLLTAAELERALLRMRQELEPAARRYRHDAWRHAVGASGSVRAVAQVLAASGHEDEVITPAGLTRLRGWLEQAGSIRGLDLPGLDADRRPVFAGGVVVLQGLCQDLGIQRLMVADGALREGVLHDLVGRMDYRDVRDQTVAALARRYHADPEQAAHVRDTAGALFAQATDPWGLDADARRWLEWAAELHEIGLDISHSGYQRHGAYIARHGDLPGFSTQDQEVLAALIQCHRRKIAPKALERVSERRQERVRRLIPLLRLAVILHRSRLDEPLPDIHVTPDTDQRLSITFPSGWLAAHPLTRVDLDSETEHWQRIGLELEVRETD